MMPSQSQVFPVKKTLRKGPIHPALWFEVIEGKSSIDKCRDYGRKVARWWIFSGGTFMIHGNRIKFEEKFEIPQQNWEDLLFHFFGFSFESSLPQKHPRKTKSQNSIAGNTSTCDWFFMVAFWPPLSPRQKKTASSPHLLPFWGD